METIEYLGVPRRVVEKGNLALRSSMFDPECLNPIDLCIVEARDRWFMVLAVSHEGGNVRQIGSEQPSLEAARALITHAADAD